MRALARGRIESVASHSKSGSRATGACFSGERVGVRTSREVGLAVILKLQFQRKNDPVQWDHLINGQEALQR